MDRFKVSIAAARVNAGLTQGEAAKELHVSKTTISNWEKGRVLPSFVTLQALSQLYGIPVDSIFLPDKLTKS